jgi:hypothetical protein
MFDQSKQVFDPYKFRHFFYQSEIFFKIFFIMTSSYPNFINKAAYSLNIDKCLKELEKIENNDKVSIRLFENFNVFAIFYKVDKTDELMALFVCSKLQGICKQKFY